MKKFFLAVFLFFCFTSVSGQWEGPTFSLNSMRTWKVVVGVGAIPSEHYAAEEFCRLFKAATGSELQTAASAGGKGAIYIGESPALLAHPLGFSVAPLGEEGLRIRITRDAVVIAGGRPRGTLYGVYEFFERYAGVRFLTKDDTYIPPGTAGTVIPPVDYLYVPPFSFRWSYYRENSNEPAFATRLRVNAITAEERLGGKTAQQLIGHTISTYVPVKVYSKDHPEYFALVNGVRRLEGTGGGPQVCSMNPDVIRIVTAAVERALDSNPSLVNISVSPQDNDLICECPICSPLNAKEESPGASHLTLVNAVAERIAKTHPGVRIGTLIYWHTRTPPKTIKLLPNVEIQLCSIEACALHPLDDPDCSRNRAFMEDFAKWKDICQNIWIWNYNTNFSAFDLPYPNFNVIAKNVQLFQNNHALGVFMQAAGGAISTEMSDLRNYVIARCLWDPTEESWELVDEFCRLHYGASAPPILAYLRFLHNNAEVRGLHPNYAPQPFEVGLDVNVSQRIYAYFQEALKLAPNDTIRQRVEKAMIPALRALLATTPRVYNNGIYRLDTSVGTGILDQYIALSKKFGMSMVGEIFGGKSSIDVYIEELLNLRKGIPAILLENKVWRMLLLPEQNGRIAELIYKPTGRNIDMPGGWWFTPPDTTKYNWKLKNGIVTMTRKLPDGSIWRRTVSLPTDTASNIRFHAEYTAGLPDPAWKLNEFSIFYSVSGSEDSRNVPIYTKNRVWAEANWGWQPDRQIILRPLLNVESGCVAYAQYNYDKNFGMQQIFEPGTFQQFRLFWYPGHRDMRIEMVTPVTSLQKGQKMSFSYEIGYLEKPPMDK